MKMKLGATMVGKNISLKRELKVNAGPEMWSQNDKKNHTQLKVAGFVFQDAQYIFSYIEKGDVNLYS